MNSPPHLLQNGNIVNFILFNPENQQDDHIRAWRRALARFYCEKNVTTADAFHE